MAFGSVAAADLSTAIAAAVAVAIIVVGAVSGAVDNEVVLLMLLLLRLRISKLDSIETEIDRYLKKSFYFLKNV
jgi:hypothetical protein